MLYQAGWIVSICFPAAVFTGVAFAASRFFSRETGLRSLVATACCIGAVASVGFYFHNDLLMPESNHRERINLIGAARTEPEDETRPGVSHLCSSRDAREMTVSMLRSRLRSYHHARATKEAQERLTGIRVELQKRYSLSFSPFALALAGLSIGIYLRRWGGLVAFGLAAVSFPVFLFLLATMEMLGRRGYVPPVAIWSPGVLFLAAGCLMLFHQARRSS